MKKFTYQLQNIYKEFLNSSKFEQKSEYSEIISSLLSKATEKIIETVQSLDIDNHESTFNEACTMTANSLGKDMATEFKDKTLFFPHLHSSIQIYLETLYALIDNTIDSAKTAEIIKLFTAQFCIKIEQSFINKSEQNKNIINIKSLSELPDELTPAYVEEIVKKLSSIPMLETNFDGKVIYKNESMNKLIELLGNDFNTKEIIPKFVQDNISLINSDFQNYKSFFSELKIENKSFQKLILVLPCARVFIVFFIEACKIPEINIRGDSSCKVLYEQVRNDSAKESFLANMSHELRTPLHEIIGFADLLSEEIDNGQADSQLEYIQMIQQGGERLLEFINHLLILSGKYENIEPLKNNFSGYTLLREVLELSNEYMSEKSIVAKINCKDIGNDLYGNKERIRKMLSEMLTYILKHMPNNSSLTLSYKSTKRDLSLYISVPANCEVKFTDEMILSHAMFFIDLMHGEFLLDVSKNNEKLFIIKIPHNT